MTNSQTYTVRGAELIATATVGVTHIELDLTLDVGALDAAEPDHSKHNIINYLTLPHYITGQRYWWSKLHRNVTVQRGAQAARVIRQTLTKIDDAIAAAEIARAARKAEMGNVFAL